MAFAAVVIFVASTKNINIAAYEKAQRLEIISHSNLGFLFLANEIKRMVIAAIPERKKEIWNASRVSTLINKPLELQRNAVKEIYKSPLLWGSSFSNSFIILQACSSPPLTLSLSSVEARTNGSSPNHSVQHCHQYSLARNQQ